MKKDSEMRHETKVTENMAAEDRRQLRRQMKDKGTVKISRVMTSNGKIRVRVGKKLDDKTSLLSGPP